MFRLAGSKVADAIGKHLVHRRCFGSGIAALAAALGSPGIRSAMASPRIAVDQLAPLFDAAVASDLSQSGVHIACVSPWVSQAFAGVQARCIITFLLSLF
jgi:hypothetical protein